MLIQKDLFPEVLLLKETERLRELGGDPDNLSQKIANAIRNGKLEDEEDRLWAELAELEASIPNEEEPSDWEMIQSVRPPSCIRTVNEGSEIDLFDRIYGAWLGRCAGCTLGKPVEGWSRAKIEAYLRSVGAYPLTSYFPVRKPFVEGLKLNKNYVETARGNIHYMARDDDIDYTILGLIILEKYGPEFSAQNIASETINSLPFNLVYTAEALAYRNVLNGIMPPATATFRNPYQEWIGAQIRADIWGYTNPGNPQKAAELAFRDASYTHTRNGIYGEMWAAACIAQAFVSNDPEQIIATGLEFIPHQSRLSLAIQDTCSWSTSHKDWQEVCDLIQAHYGNYHPIHVIPNTCLIVMGLLLGEGDLEKSICLTVMGGCDTDCTAATVGSMIGAMLGRQALPEKWIAPLNDRARSLIPGFHETLISELARRTVALVNKNG